MVSKSFICVFLLLVGLTLNAIFGSGPFSWGVGFVYIGYDTALLLFVSVSMLKILKRGSDLRPRISAATSGARVSVGVVITARNEATVLRQCLAALENQTDLPDCIFWIDDGSTDGSRQMLEQYRPKRLPKLELRFKPNSGKASSLNQYWPEVPAEVLITLDADTLLEPDAVAEIRRAFSENPNLVETGGLLTPTSIFKPGQIFETFQRFEYIRSFLARRAWMSRNALLLVSGAFAAYRKKVLVEVGGYDPDSLVEDYDLTHRIHRYSFDHGLHYEVGVTVSARATTDVPVSLQQFLRQRRRWFAGFLQTQFKYGDMVGNKKYGTIGRFMLVIKSADTLQPVFGLITLATLIFFVITKRMIHPLIWKALLAKIIIDLVFHYASVAIYYRWRGERPRGRVWALSTVSTFLEPVSFQIFRHFGAFLGWISFLRGNSHWHPQRKS